MQRRAHAPAAALAAAVLAAALTACSGGAGADGGDDSKPGHAGSTAPAAQPGKYRSLPEPCGYVNRETLRKLLPTTGDDEADRDTLAKLYKGQAAITYDTDRRVGCHWKLEAPEGTRHLNVDFERVVSYQPGVSDEQRAEQLYGRRAAAAHIPVSSGSPSAPAASASASGSGSPSKGASPGPHPQGGAQSGSPSPSASRPGAPSASGSPAGGASLAPRVLDDLGDDAFIDDKLITAGSGVHRDINIVFRSANVIVTISYDQWSNDKQHVPGSEDLQGKAQTLARELDAGHFNN
ncbi:hypothetical protein [Streptomyces hiroshimensis]|uniref:DUF3558 domain-containing protein n=1 Tax=Streptomyces hiroshimensis TaxID=66424 RepID=A0ABQ2ZDZ3_9ACTN|nr:hypothetical protein [Streptomyces hiroshimensis]GGY09433.1 hypothetical protein GCM10010324_65460 [Streptomyces hiroshimensis]